MSTRTDIESALAARDYAALVERIAPDEPDAALVRTRRFAANMLALCERDPALAAELDATPSTGRVRPAIPGGYRAASEGVCGAA